MITMSFGLAFLVLLGIGIAAYGLGYVAAESRERTAKRTLDRNLRLATRQKRELSQWVHRNWPDEYAAYRRGHTEGYQQGILQSPELERDHADAP